MCLILCFWSLMSRYLGFCSFHPDLPFTRFCHYPDRFIYLRNIKKPLKHSQSVSQKEISTPLCSFVSHFTHKNHPSWNFLESHLATKTNSFCPPLPFFLFFHCSQVEHILTKTTWPLLARSSPSLSLPSVCHRRVRSWPVYGCNYMFMSIFVSLLEGVCVYVFVRGADDSVCLRVCVWERKCVHCELWE